MSRRTQNWREIRFTIEDIWDLLRRSYWLNVGCTLLGLLVWCGLVAYTTCKQTLPIDFKGHSVLVRDYIWYWLGGVGFWMFNHGWYVLIFLFRQHAIRLKHYWTFLVLGLAALAFLYSFHLTLGAVFTLFPLFNTQYRDYLMGATDHTRHERGGDLLTSHTAERYYRRLRPRNDPGVLWGGVCIPTHHAVTNFLVIGTVGSGKTLTLRLLMQSLLHVEKESFKEPASPQER